MTEADRSNQAIQVAGSRLARLSEASLRILQDLELETVLQGIVDGARLLTEARYGALLVFDDSGKVQDFLTSGITPEERGLVGYCCPEGRGLLGYLSETGKPLRLRDFASHPASVGIPENHPPVKSFLGAPIPSLRQGIGNIYLSEKEGGHEFTPEDEEIVVMFARQAALAISNAERYRDEQRAKASLEALAEASPVGVLVVDAQTRTVVSVNREAQRITGVGPGIPLDQYRASASYRRLDGSELPLESHPLEGALARGESVRGKEVVFNLPDGRKVTALISATPVFSQDGELVAAVGTLDITPLEELERLRSEFLGMVSHELRAPLASIKGATSMALGDSRRQDPTAIHQLFQIIDVQTNLMRDLIDDLLDMTRIEAGSLSVTLAPAAVDDLVAEARDSFLRDGASNIIEVDLAEELPRILADRGRILQVLGNLLSNACRHSSGSSTIRIAAVQEDRYVAISVADEGRGVSDEEMPHLFGKFSRLAPGHGEEETAGNGLGLAICRGIVEAHGGRIWAVSDGPDLGTRFTFTVPVVAKGEDGETNGPVHRSDRSDRTHRQHARVLVVDDDPQILWYVRSTLSEAGYK
ncbi:MAG: ATP-binding protein, partial [Dehalococcoidia bacterium]|nr:ATP-binding protein [Dehalococcoidia bacterium]